VSATSEIALRVDRQAGGPPFSLAGVDQPLRNLPSASNFWIRAVLSTT
jgi:hypothetical protein